MASRAVVVPLVVACDRGRADFEVDATKPSCHRFLYMHSAKNRQLGSSDQKQFTYRAGQRRKKRKPPSRRLIHQDAVVR